MNQDKLHESDRTSKLGVRSKDNRWLTLAVLAIAQFAVLVDITIVNVALPSIEHNLHFSQSGLQWVISAYTVVFGGFLLLGGRIADFFGRRRFFMVGLVLFGVGSLFAGLASTANSLIAMRVLQAFGAAALTPAALSIVTVTFPHGRDRNIAMGIWGGLAGLGGTAGVVVGGLLVSYFSWHWVFFVNVPVVLVTLIGTPILVRESHGRNFEVSKGRFDLTGALIGTSGILSVVFGIVRTQALGWGSTEVIVAIGGGVFALVLFVIVEGRSSAPLMPLGLFRSRGFNTALPVLALNGAAFLSMFFLTAIFLQDVRGDSALQAGLHFLPMGVSAVLMAVLASQLVTKIGTRVVQIAGVIASITGLVLLSRAGSGGNYIESVMPGIILFGAGIIATGVAAQIVALTDVTNHHAGSASGMINTFFQVGGSLGLAIVATISASKVTSAIVRGATRPQALVLGYSRGLIISALFAGLALLLSFMAPRIRPTADEIRAVV